MFFEHAVDTVSISWDQVEQRLSRQVCIDGYPVTLRLHALGNLSGVAIASERTYYSKCEVRVIQAEPRHYVDNAVIPSLVTHARYRGTHRRDFPRDIMKGCMDGWIGRDGCHAVPVTKASPVQSELTSVRFCRTRSSDTFARMSASR